MADDLSKLEQRHSALQAAIERLAQDDPDKIPGTYITGRDGVPPRRRRQLDDQIERSVTHAVALTGAIKELQQVEAKIGWILSGGREKIASREAMVRRAQEELFTRIQVGDLVNIGGNHPVKVVRKNRKSVTTDSGVRFTIYEIYAIEKGSSDV